MYYVYAKKESTFESKSLMGEYSNLDKAYERIKKELEKNKEFKYILEETTGHVDNYGELIPEVVEEN